MDHAMGYPDIDRAREGQQGLRRIIETYAGPGADLRALRRVVDLCRQVQDAIDTLTKRLREVKPPAEKPVAPTAATVVAPPTPRGEAPSMAPPPVARPPVQATHPWACNSAQSP